MPRTRSLAWSELKIGLLTVVAILIAMALVFALGGQTGLPWNRYELKVRFPEAAGVKPGSPVRVAGVEVGSVRDLAFVGAEVELSLQVRESIRDLIRTTSVASLGTVSLLGEGAVDITARTDGTPVPDGGYVPYGAGSGSLSDIAAQAGEGLEQITTLMADLGEGEGTVGRLLTDEALYEELTDMASAASETIRGLREGDGSLGRLLRDDTMTRELEASMENLSMITGRIRAGEGSLGRLVADEQFARSLEDTTAHFEALSARLAGGEGTIGKLLADEALYTRLAGLVDRFETVAERLSDGTGTAGALLNDRALHDSVTATVGELRALIADIRADPRRYLQVRVSIF